MHLLNIVSLLSCVAAVRAAPDVAELESRKAVPKANEYKSGDWSSTQTGSGIPYSTGTEELSTYSAGSLNYGHHCGNLVDVTMDDTTHSVYLAANGGNTWEAWAGKTDNGRGCGEKLGLVSHLECLNLDKTYSKRIRCVRHHPQ